MPAPIPDDKRDAIIDDIRAGQLGARAIARKHHVAASTVSKIASDERIDDAFDRSHLVKAVRAREFDAKAARLTLLIGAYAKAQHFLDRVEAKYEQWIPGANGVERIVSKLPPARDQQAMMTSFGIAVDKALALETYDAGDGQTGGRTMVNDLFGALRLAHHQIVAADAAVPGGDADGPVSPPAGT